MKIFCGTILAAMFALLAAARPVSRPAMAERIAAEEDVYGIVHWGLNTAVGVTDGNGSTILLTEFPDCEAVATYFRLLDPSLAKSDKLFTGENRK